MRKTWMVAGLLAALGCAACDDDNDKKVADYTPACTASDGYCAQVKDKKGNVSDVRMICLNGELVNIPCAADKVCTGHGYCVSKAERTCSDGPAECTDDWSAVEYCVNGVVHTTTCPNGTVCYDDPKGSFCMNPASDYKCVVDTPRCREDGRREVCRDVGGVTVWADDPCAAGQTCDNGVCVKGDACKTENAVRCSDKGVREVCAYDNENNLVWSSAPCSSGSYCEYGICQKAEACLDGEKRCGVGNSIEICAGGSWKGVDWNSPNDANRICNRMGADMCVAGRCVDSADIRELASFMDDVYGNGNNGNNGGGGGGGGGGATCDAYDCSGQYGSECASGLKALCIAEGFVGCFAADPSQDADCADSGDGKTYWTTPEDTEHYYCLIVGSDASCLSGGGGGGGGGSDNVLTCADYEQQAGGACVMADGTTSCAQYCGAEACCVNLTQGIVDCGCTGLGGGGGGGGGSTEACMFFDCSTLTNSAGESAASLCAADGYDTAACDAEYGLYCLNRNKSLDASCTSGVGYDYPKSDGTTGQDCIVIGADDSCFAGGGGGGGSSSGLWLCAQYDEACSETYPGSKAICFQGGDGNTYYGCGKSCSSEGATSKACDYFGDDTYAAYPTVCTKLDDGSLYYVDGSTSESDYQECSSTCNADNSACK